MEFFFKEENQLSEKSIKIRGKLTFFTTTRHLLGNVVYRYIPVIHGDLKVTFEALFSYHVSTRGSRLPLLYKQLHALHCISSYDNKLLFYEHQSC
jgi:hypothetical protein